MRKLMILAIVALSLLLLGCQNQAAPTGYAGYGGGYGGYQGGYQGQQAPAQGGAYAGYGCGVATEIAYEDSAVIQAVASA